VVSTPALHTCTSNPAAGTHVPLSSACLHGNLDGKQSPPEDVRALRMPQRAVNHGQYGSPPTLFTLPHGTRLRRSDPQWRVHAPLIPKLRAQDRSASRGQSCLATSHYGGGRGFRRHTKQSPDWG